MLSRLEGAEKKPDEGWKTLPQYKKADNAPEDEVLLLDEGDESKQCSPKTRRSPLEYKCHSFKIPLKRISKSTDNESPAGANNDNIKTCESGFTSKLRSSAFPRGNAKSENIRCRIERQRNLSLTERLCHPQKNSKQLNLESSRTTNNHEQPFDAEINMVKSNQTDNNTGILEDKDLESPDGTEESSEENCKETTQQDTKPSKKHIFPSSKVIPRPSLHNQKEKSFYGTTSTPITYRISKNRTLGSKNLTTLHPDAKKRKLSDDEDEKDGQEEPTAQKKNTNKRRSKRSIQPPEVSLVEIISSDEEDKTESNKITDHSTAGPNTTANDKPKKDGCVNIPSKVTANTTVKDNPFERDNFTTEIAIGPRAFLGSLQGTAKGPLEITVNQLKWKMAYKEETTTILICPQDFTLMKVHLDKDPKIIVLGVSQRLALKLRGKFPGHGKFLDPGSLVVSECDIVLEVDDNIHPEMVLDLAEWAKETHGKQFDEISQKDAQSIMDRFKAQSVLKSCHYYTRSSSSSSKVPNATPTQLFIYPGPPLTGGITITSADLECLAQGEFLNDVIIDFYLKYIYHDILNEEDQQRTHIFSSFFYKRLTQRMSSDAEGAPSSQHRLHNKVKKWTRNVDIFNKDFIIVPINESSHWFLAIICYPQLDNPVFEEDMLSYDVDVESETTEEEGDSEDLVETGKKETVNKQLIIKANPCILIFDSLAGFGRARITANLRSYLSCEWKEKRQDQPCKEFTKETIKGAFPKVPKQENHCDCGIFLLQYVESFFQDPIKNFRSPINKVDWFTQRKVATKREEIKNLIYCLSQKSNEDVGYG